MDHSVDEGVESKKGSSEQLSQNMVNDHTTMYERTHPEVRRHILHLRAPILVVLTCQSFPHKSLVEKFVNCREGGPHSHHKRSILSFATKLCSLSGPIVSAVLRWSRLSGHTFESVFVQISHSNTVLFKRSTYASLSVPVRTCLDMQRQGIRLLSAVCDRFRVLHLRTSCGMNAFGFAVASHHRRLDSMVCRRTTIKPHFQPNTVLSAVPL